MMNYVVLSPKMSLVFRKKEKRKSLSHLDAHKILLFPQLDANASRKEEED